MDRGLSGKPQTTSSGSSLWSRRIAAAAPQCGSAGRRIDGSYPGRLRTTDPAPGEPLESSALSRLFLDLILRPRDSGRTAYRGIGRECDALEGLPGGDGAGTSHGGLGARLARVARELVRHDSRFRVECRAAGDSSRPAKGGTTESRRSEERRVGKECRSRWSPYH